MAQGTGSHPCPWPKFITMFNYWRSLGNLIWPIAILHYSWGRVTNWGSLLLSRNKNFWYFLGAISGLKLGWTSKITFQLIGEALRIICFFIIEWRIIVKHFNLIQNLSRRVKFCPQKYYLSSKTDNPSHYIAAICMEHPGVF